MVSWWRRYFRDVGSPLQEVRLVHTSWSFLEVGSAFSVGKFSCREEMRTVASQALRWNLEGMVSRYCAAVSEVAAKKAGVSLGPPRWLGTVEDRWRDRVELEAGTAGLVEPQDWYERVFEELLSPANLEEPFVLAGGGAPRGLSMLEHWSWMQQQPVPEEKPRIAQDLAEAVAFKLVHSPEEINDLRYGILQQWRAKAKEFEPLGDRWAAQAHPKIQQVVKKCMGRS